MAILEQNPYGYGNSQIYLRNVEVKSIYKCTIMKLHVSFSKGSHEAMLEEIITGK